MKKRSFSALGVAAVGEVATGLILVLHPPLLVRLLLGSSAAGVASVICRVAGVALVALGVACWPWRRPAEELRRAHAAMLTYSLFVAIYLFYLGAARAFAGVLLWPVALAHAALALLLARSLHRLNRASV
jgi:hypothetical protein